MHKAFVEKTRFCGWQDCYSLFPRGSENSQPAAKALPAVGVVGLEDDGTYCAERHGTGTGGVTENVSAEI